MKNAARSASIRSMQRPHFLSISAQKEIEAIIRTAELVGRRDGRFAIYTYLVAVYGAHRKWRRLGRSKKTARQIACQFRLLPQKSISPIRIVIEATLPEAGRKQHSRWVRALQFAATNEIPPDGLLDFFHSNGGVAGCARLAARHRSERRTQQQRSAGRLTPDWPDNWSVASRRTD